MSIFQPRGPMRVRTWQDHGRGVAEVQGEVDVYTAPELREALSQVQAQSDRPCLALLLAGLTFMDSTGIGLLVAAHKRAAMAGGMVGLVEAPEFLAKILRITGLAPLLPAFGSLEHAWAHLDGVCGAAR